MELLNTHPIKKSDLGFHGNLFGGKLLFGRKLIYLYQNRSIMKKYRKIWEDVNGPIPVDGEGRTYHIHHIDGNRNNNSIENLQCVSIEEHYNIHLQQYKTSGSRKDLAAMRFLAGWMSREPELIKGYVVTQDIRDKIANTLRGKKRPIEVVDKVNSKLRGRKQSVESVEARKRGLKEYYKNANIQELQERWIKISKAHKGKVVKDSTKTKLGRIVAKLTDEQALEVFKLVNEGVNYRILSERFGISQGQITMIKQKKSYKWLWS
jgi:hypothetical protein